jgi:hypothetical protein
MQDISRARQEAKERAYPGGTINLSCEVVSPQVDFGRQSGYGRLRRMHHRANIGPAAATVAAYWADSERALTTGPRNIAV